MQALYSTSSSQIGIGDYMRTIEDVAFEPEYKDRLNKNPLYNSINKDISSLENEKTQIKDELKLSKPERNDLHIYDADVTSYRGREISSQVDMGVIVGVSCGLTMAAMHFAGISASIIPGIVDSLAGTIIGLSAPAIAYAYIKASKKFIIPQKVDAYIMNRLKLKENEIDVKIENLKKNKLKIEDNIKSELGIYKQPENQGNTINTDDENIVIIGGIKLKKNPNKLLGFLFS